MNHRMGGAKNQVVVDAGSVALGNLIIIPRCGGELTNNDGSYYVKPPIVGQNDNLWCPCYEANPINPFTGHCRQDEESTANPFAIKLVKSFAKASHSGDTVAGSSEAKATLTSKPTSPMMVDTDNTSVKNVMAKALESTVDAVVGKIVRDDDASSDMSLGEYRIPMTFDEVRDQ